MHVPLLQEGDTILPKSSVWLAGNQTYRLCLLEERQDKVSSMCRNLKEENLEHSRGQLNVIKVYTFYSIQLDSSFGLHLGLCQSWSEVKWNCCRIRLFATPWTVAYQASPSMGFSRQEYCSGLPFPSPGNLPDPGIKPRSPALQADSFNLWAIREAHGKWQINDVEWVNNLRAGNQTSSIHEILQARILEWLPCPPPGNLLYRGSKLRLLHLLQCRQILCHWTTRKP